MKTLILNQTVYTVEDGKLKELGAADCLEHITGDVYKSAKETFVIQNGKVSVLGNDECPMPVVSEVISHVPAEIIAYRNDFQIIPSDAADKDTGMLYQKYFEILSEFSVKDFEHLVHDGIVLRSNNGNVRLLIKDETGSYREEKIINVGADKPAFIYRGGLYISDCKLLRFVRLDFKPLITAPRYMIFWGGGSNLFAMSLQQGIVEFRPLGYFDTFIKTDVNQLLRVKTHDYIDIFYLGKDINHVMTNRNDEQCSIDVHSGDIRHQYLFRIDGADYDSTSTYRFENCAYVLD